MKAIVLAAVVVLACAVLGVAIALVLAPAETSIDEGWKLAWGGLATGALAGVGGLWLAKRRKA